MDASPDQPNAGYDEDELVFGLADLILLLALAAAAVYFLCFRSKRPSSAKPNPYVIQPTSSPAAGADKGFLSKMRHSKRRMVVFYGSQTGTAEEFASRLSKEGAKYGLKGIVADPEETDMEDLSKISGLEKELGGPCLAVFFMATYGEGDPTDNAQEFYEWLKGEADDLNHLNYAVFGLGNKTYEHFNAMGIYVDKRLAELGGRRIHPVGLGDDDINLEDDFITWKETFWSVVCKEFKIESVGDDISMRQYETSVLPEGHFNPDRVYTGEVARLKSYAMQKPPFDLKNPFLAPILVNRNLHSPHSDRYCMHIELGLGESRIRYDPGDHVAIYPTNNVHLVERIGQLLDVQLDTVFTMKNLDDNSSKKSPFPCPTTYRTALLHYVDITALPRTHVLKELASYTTDPAERDKLLLMSTSSPEGRDLYQNWIVGASRHITHILEDLQSCRPDIRHLLELLPRLQARFYSISSSPRAHKDRIHLTAVVVEYTTKTGRTNKGVATTWLRPMIPESGDTEASTPCSPFRVPIYVRRSQFRLPNRAHVPIIMIGPGTGVAPFRAFAQERACLKAEGKVVGETHLFFGCRHRDQDFLYREELEQLVADGVLTLHLAFSRDQQHKVYVTDRLLEKAADVWRLIGEQGGHIYVCGDAKNMAKDVHKAIIEIVQQHGGKTQPEAEKFVKTMEQLRKYCADVWS